MGRAIFFLCLGVLAAPVEAAERVVLRPDGLGTVTFGMTLDEAQAALGTPLVETRDAGSPSKTCRHVKRADGVEPSVVYMVENGKITRAEIFRPRGQPAPPIATAEGIAIGASDKTVRAKYRGRLKATPNTYSETGTDIEVFTPGGQNGLLFEIEKGTVASLRAGLVPSVRYIEGCL